MLRFSIMMAVALSLPLAANAQTAGDGADPQIPANYQPPMHPDMPKRGVSMDRVEANLGMPVNKDSAVGDPPITRWEYDNFYTFFEYDKVLHSVMKRQGGV